jgi:predicted nucleic acid-binding protein
MPRTMYLADTSFMLLQGRHRPVRERYEQLLIENRVALCQMTALEWLNNAPSRRDHEALWQGIQSHRWVDVTTDAMDRAMDTHRKLAETGQHRRFSLPDLIIAATAEQHEATLLHYDSDFERIAAVTGQPIEWVVPRGSF